MKLDFCLVNYLTYPEHLVGRAHMTYQGGIQIDFHKFDIFTSEA